ncbi:MAG: hypothetical protein ABIA93_02680 [Candidatus Woesearchaeota archaeon]
MMRVILFASIILVGGGFMIGLIPFVYLIAAWWVIPLAVMNLIFSILLNEVKGNSIAAVVLAFVTLIPFPGTLTAIAGIILSIISAISVGKRL